MIPKPKPCPKCGDRPIVHFVCCRVGAAGYQVRCDRCGVSAPPHQFDAAAVADWNRQVARRRART